MLLSLLTAIAHLSFLLDWMSHAEIYQNIRIYARLFREYYRSILRANCKYWRLIFLHHWFSLYGSVAYIRNMVTLATIQSIFCIFHIFKGNSFMQRGFCRCKMCLNIRMDKSNNLLCTLYVFLMVFTRLKLRWVYLQC
jgi:hypothetical protein